MGRRPVGHVTEAVRELARWKANREAKGLGSRPLTQAMMLLEEYRELLAQEPGFTRDR